MAQKTGRLKAQTPKNLLAKPVTINAKELFLSLAKVAVHCARGQFEEIKDDAQDTLAAFGLETTPGERAYRLIERSLKSAMRELVEESAGLRMTRAAELGEKALEGLDFEAVLWKVEFDKRFLTKPGQLEAIQTLQKYLARWLEAGGLDKAAAGAVARRLPSYFVFALNEEWRKNFKDYQPLLEAMETPFTGAAERESAWSAYNALLEKRAEEGVFDEAFSLRQIFVPLNAYYVEDSERGRMEISHGRVKRVRKVVALDGEIQRWLKGADRQDCIRVISGGPGSGKSSYARILAADVAKSGKQRVLFVPLHLIDPDRDLTEEVGRFVRDEGFLAHNPLDPETGETDLLILFDGLDELASQGKVAAACARAFVAEVEKTVTRRNLAAIRLRVILSGRELVVQESESEFRRPRQILTLLPYKVAERTSGERDEEEYSDPNDLLKQDLRQEWWRRYGKVTGRAIAGLPDELAHKDLDEITAQPLLNYLVALSYTRGKLDFGNDVNLNAVYRDLVAAVHERGYEGRPWSGIKRMSLEDFERVLEEVGLAAWHGDGRSTTVREIEEHCRQSGLDGLLKVFQEGAEAGVTRLLAAFFFRQYGQRPGGDRTFIFTHKSFGEYLTAQRIVLAVEKIAKELDRRAKSPDDGWDVHGALEHWARVCGPSVMTAYLFRFVADEVRLRSKAEVDRWQTMLTELFSIVLQLGMPMERLQTGGFRVAASMSRNAEEALLAVLNACARFTERVSAIRHPNAMAFGAWFKRIQGQRTDGGNPVASACLSYLNLKGCSLHMGDFYDANLMFSVLEDTGCAFACFVGASLQRARLRGCDLAESNLERAVLSGADLGGVHWDGARLTDAQISPHELEIARERGAWDGGAIAGDDRKGHRRIRTRTAKN